MSNNWLETTLEEACLVVTDGAHNSPKSVDVGLPMASVKDLTPYGITIETCRLISEDDFQKLVKWGSKPQKGDVLIAKDGATALDTVCEIRNDINVVLLSSVAILRPNPNIITPAYLRYYLDSPSTRSYMKGSFITGAAIPRVVLKDFKRVKIRIPNANVQHRIADILSAYDDLIENNTRRIHIFEQMAQAIYLEWFGKVDKESLPKGWEVIEVKQIINRLPKGTVYEQQDVIEEGEVIVIDQSRAEFLGFHNNVPDFEASPSNPIAIFGDHTCKMQLLVRPFSIGPNVVPFTSKLGYPIHYVFSVVSGLVETKEYKRHWNDLSAKKVALPPLKLAKEFSVIIEPMLAQQDMLARKNAILRRTRDLLLPRLVSGEIELQ